MADTPSGVAQALLFTCFEQKDFTNAAQLLSDSGIIYIKSLAKIQQIDILKFFQEALSLIDTDAYLVRLNKVRQSILKQGIIHANLTLLEVFFAEGFRRNILGEPEIVSGKYSAVGSFFQGSVITSAKTIDYCYEYTPKLQPSCYARNLYETDASYTTLATEKKQAIINFLEKSCDIQPLHRATVMRTMSEEVPVLVDAPSPVQSAPQTYFTAGYDRDQIDATEVPFMSSSTTDTDSGSDDVANIPATWDPQTPTPTPLSLLFIDSSTRRYCSPLRSQLDTGLIRPSSPGIT